MVRKTIVTIEKEVQDFVWVAVLNHKQSNVWNEHTDIQVFEDLENARQWAAKECHRLLNNMVSRMKVMPYKSNMEWYDDYDLSMVILNKDSNGVLKVQDRIDVYIYKKEIR